jgi:signal transduction histidine kinase
VKLLDLDVPLPVIGDQAVFMRDVTEEREMARRVIAFERRAAAGDLLTGVAHEVRNPLAAIQAAAEALQRRPAVAEEAALLGVIRRQVDRLGALMRDLLHVGRPAPAPVLEEVDLTAICEGVARTWPAGGDRRPVRLSRPSGAPLRVRAEEARLEQALLNLLDNAAHHSPAGSPIRLELSRNGSSACLRVSDRGTGIAPEILPRVFEPFFTTRPEGTGLGLALVKSIVESYGGAVIVGNNGPAPGCTFEIRLPVSPGGGE